MIDHLSACVPTLTNRTSVFIHTYVEKLHLLSQFVRELTVGRKVTCTRACRKENGQHYYVDK